MSRRQCLSALANLALVALAVGGIVLVGTTREGQPYVDPAGATDTAVLPAERAALEEIGARAQDVATQVGSPVLLTTTPCAAVRPPRPPCRPATTPG